MSTILIICRSMRTAGVETLVLRLSKWYYSKGNNVKVLLIHKKGNLLNELIEIAEVKSFNVDNFFKYPFLNEKIIIDPFFDGVEEVFSVFPTGNWIAAQICNILKVPLKIGIYHPLDYFKTFSKYEKELFNQLPDGCKIFMNVECLRSTEQIFDRKFDSVILPLPVVDISKVKKIRCPQKNKIVSIGRFDVSKSYNLTMINTINELNKEGYELYYDIYGYGYLEDSMRALINELDVNEKIRIKGELQYGDYSSVMSSAYIFVGCGTSVIESSFYGVPSIVATEKRSTADSNGFFCDIDGYNVGENIPDFKTTSIKELIIFVLSLSDSEYHLLCEKHQKTAIDKYEINNVCEQFDSLNKEYINNNKLINTLIIKSAWSYKLKVTIKFFKHVVKKILSLLGLYNPKLVFKN